MATPRGRKVIQEEAPPIAPEIIEENGGDFGNLVSFLEEMQEVDTATISVYRDSKGRAVGAYLFKCTPSEFSLADVLDKLRDEYDGGSFRIIIFANGQRVKNQLVEVEAPKKSAFDFMRKNEPIAVAPPQNDLAHALLQIQEAMRNQSDSMRDMMLTQQQENTKMLLQVLAAKDNHAAPQQTSLAEMLQLLTVAQSIGGGKSDSISPDKMLEMFFEGMKQGREMGGGGESENVLTTAIKAFGPTIAEITSKMAQQQPQPQSMQQRRELPGPTPIRPESQVTNIEDRPAPEAPDPTAALQPYIAMLVNAAQVDGDPEVYANLLLDQIPEQVLREYLESDINYQMLLGYFPPESATCFPWFDSLRALVLEFLAQEPDGGGEGDAIQHDENVPRGTRPPLQENGNAPE